MAIVLAIIISLAIYLGGGWCAYNIYLSFQDIDTMTLQGIYSSEIAAYNIVAAIANVIFAALWEKSEGGISDSQSNKMLFLSLGVPVITWLLCSYVLPISMGASILNTVLNILTMCIFASMWLRRAL